MRLTFNKIRTCIGTAVLALMMSHSVLAAGGSIELQDQDTIKGQRMIEYLKALLTAPTLVGFPNVPAIDNATTAPNGLGFVSISGAERTGVTAEAKKLNGTIALGVGIGSAEETISVQPMLTITTVDDLGGAGYAGLKFSRRIHSGDQPIYAGVSFNRLGSWGDNDSPLDPTRTFSLTGFSSFISDAKKYPVMWTLGYGSNVKDSGDEEGFQAGIGMGVYKNTALGLSTNGDVLNTGLSINLPDMDDINLSIGFSDILDNDNARSFYLAVSYTFQAFGD